MDCGVPFCQTGCPVNNLIPDWNDLVYHGRWKEAVRQLHATNNFPEFTGRICPAPCEASCVLGINQPAVTIKQIEKNIVERGFHEGWIRPEPPKIRTGKKVAIVGSGPAGLAAAQQLCRAGHSVVVYEKADRIGGLLRYGIPQFKLEKHIIDRRLEQMSAEGVKFVTGAEVGKNIAVEDLRSEFDAIVLAGGAEHSRDLNVPGRDLKGIHFAMEFLPQQNRRNLGDTIPPENEILATGKRVVIIGGGDTGADCLGTCHRQKPLSVHQFEIMPKPPDERSPLTPWPLWPMQLRTRRRTRRRWSSRLGHRHHQVHRPQFWATSSNCTPCGLARRQRSSQSPAPNLRMEADLVLIAMGFVGPVRNGMIDQLGVKLDARGNVATDQNHMTSLPGVFAAGDMRRGQSLVVWAIAEGRKTAASVDRYLQTNALPLATPQIANIEKQPIAS